MAQEEASIDTKKEHNSSVSESIWSTLVAQCEKTHQMYRKSAHHSHQGHSGDDHRGDETNSPLDHSTINRDDRVSVSDKSSFTQSSPFNMVKDQHHKKQPASPSSFSSPVSEPVHSSLSPAAAVTASVNTVTETSCTLSEKQSNSTEKQVKTQEPGFTCTDEDDDELRVRSKVTQEHLAIDINGNYDSTDRNDLSDSMHNLRGTNVFVDAVDFTGRSSPFLVIASDECTSEENGVDEDVAQESKTLVIETEKDQTDGMMTDEKESSVSTEIAITPEPLSIVEIVSDQDKTSVTSDCVYNLEVGNDVIAVASLLMALQQKSKTCDEESEVYSAIVDRKEQIVRKNKEKSLEEDDDGEKESKEILKMTEKDASMDDYADESTITHVNNSCSLIVEDEIDSAVASIMKDGEEDESNSQSTPTTPASTVDVASISNLVSQDEAISSSNTSDAIDFTIKSDDDMVVVAGTESGQESEGQVVEMHQMKEGKEEEADEQARQSLISGHISPITPVSSPEQTGQSPVTGVEASKRTIHPSESEEIVTTEVIDSVVKDTASVQVKPPLEEDTVAKAVAIAINGSDDDEDDLIKLPSTTASLLNMEDGAQYVLWDEVCYQVTSAPQTTDILDRGRAVAGTVVGSESDLMQITSSLLGSQTFTPAAPSSVVTGNEVRNVHTTAVSPYGNSTSSMNEYQGIVTYRCNVPGCAINHTYSSLNQRPSMYSNGSFNGRSVSFSSDTRTNAITKDRDGYAEGYFASRSVNTSSSSVSSSSYASSSSSYSSSSSRSITGRQAAPASPLEMLEQQFAGQKGNGYLNNQSQSQPLAASGYIPLHSRDKWSSYDAIKLSGDMTSDQSQMRSSVKSKPSYYGPASMTSKQSQYTDQGWSQSSFKRPSVGQAYRSMDPMNSSSSLMYSRGYASSLSRPGGGSEYSYARQKPLAQATGPSFDMYQSSHLQKQEQPHLQSFYRSFGSHAAGNNNVSSGQYLCSDKCCSANNRITSLNAPINMGEQQTFNSNYSYASPSDLPQLLTCVDSSKRVDLPSIRSTGQYEYQFAPGKRLEPIDVSKYDNGLSLPPAKLPRHDV